MAWGHFKRGGIANSDGWSRREYVKEACKKLRRMDDKAEVAGFDSREVMAEHRLRQHEFSNL